MTTKESVLRCVRTSCKCARSRGNMCAHAFTTGCPKKNYHFTFYLIFLEPKTRITIHFYPDSFHIEIHVFFGRKLVFFIISIIFWGEHPFGVWAPQKSEKYLISKSDPDDILYPNVSTIKIRMFAKTRVQSPKDCFLHNTW